ncbi:MAG TPA: hypothetical protein VGE52_00205, partial [Pirellulales bacterium]
MLEFAADELETTPCPACGCSDRSAVADAPSFGACRVVACASCGILYLNPRPKPVALARCYPDDYACHAPPSRRELERRRRRLGWER